MDCLTAMKFFEFPDAQWASLQEYPVGNAVPGIPLSFDCRRTRMGDH